MENENIIKVNGIEPPLRLKSEPGRYTKFVIEVKKIISNDLNAGKILEVTMPNKIEAKKLLEDLIELKVDESLYIMKLQNNLLVVQKYITIKTGK